MIMNIHQSTMANDDRTGFFDLFEIYGISSEKKLINFVEILLSPKETRKLNIILGYRG